VLATRFPFRRDFSSADKAKSVEMLASESELPNVSSSQSSDIFSGEPIRWRVWLPSDVFCLNEVGTYRCVVVGSIVHYARISRETIQATACSGVSVG
jgi:hypothetical protein